MAIAGMPEEARLELVASTLTEMEVLGHRLRELIATQPPYDLLGYIYGLLLMQKAPGSPQEMEGSGQAKGAGTVIDDTQFVLEYVHAVLATTSAQGEVLLDEKVCAELFECAPKLRMTAMLHVMMSSGGTEDGVFGPNTADVEFQAKTTWVTLRGNRYMVLEGEFYAFVLGPHDKILRETYGIGASEIATGFQEIANSIRTGHTLASEKFAEQLDAAQAFAEAQGRSLEETTAEWGEKHADGMTSVALALDDMVRGGTCNVSRHTTLPPVLLADLAYERGEETEFFADGPYSGTPFRTLPVRKKPLIKLGDDYYAIDPCYIRDAGYRALLHSLLLRRADYKKEFEDRQKAMSEAAVFEILSNHLQGAVIYQEVYYKDTVTRQWAESDTLILIDDVLMLVEAKAGAAATIASPALDFPRHALAVQELVIKAYRQCKRFFEYLQSADEVPIFKLENGKHIECGRLRHSDYRLMFPIGLTVESFSPFSAMCKELPDITPILGKHPFLSLSIDDLFVLKRFLPTMGQLAHYLEVRQIVAGMKGTHLFDEFDHLGAYIKRNRFDLDLAKQLSEEKPTMVWWDGMSEVVDRYFEGINWEAQPIPAQDFHPELRALLNALNHTRAAGWLSAESSIRNFAGEARNALADLLANCRETLDKHVARNITVMDEPPLFIWLQRAGTTCDQSIIHDKACTAALAAKTSDMMAIRVVAEADGSYITAERFHVDMPSEQTAANLHLYAEAERMKCRVIPVKAVGTEQRSTPVKRPGRNEPCWCGSKLKFKKCHGR